MFPLLYGLMEKSYIERIYRKNNSDYVKTYSELIRENKNETKQSIKIQLDECVKIEDVTDLWIKKGMQIVKCILIVFFVLIACSLIVGYLYSKKMGYDQSFISEMTTIDGGEGYLIASLVFAVLWGIGIFLYKKGSFKNKIKRR